MSKQTESEVLFERFCEENSIQFTPIFTSTERTPDYEFFPNGNLIIAEITQFDSNPEDKQYSKDLAEKGTAGIGGKIGSRVRQKIADKAPQLRIRNNGSIPTILILYNNTEVLSYTDPDYIRAGMYGLDTYIFDVPRNFSQNITIVDRKFGREQKLNERCNTSLSTLGVIETTAHKNKTTLKIYHNIYARSPINPIWFNKYPVEQFTLETKNKGEFQYWTLIEVE